MLWTIGGVVVLLVVGLIAFMVIKDKIKDQRVRKQGKPIITAMVMANDRFLAGSLPQAAGVVIFGFYDPSPKLRAALQTIAQRAFALYEAETTEGLTPACARFAKTIKDHDYTENRRYRVPQELCGALEVYTADLWIDRDRLSKTWDEDRLIACAITGKLKGEIVQLPAKDPAAVKLYTAVRGN